ncbi:MAG: hypothetical protein ACFFFK_13070 [Candidatus Thorarchaeota archaeon]
MVVRMVVRVTLDNMDSTVIYPAEEQSAERVALLTGIVQLVSTALQRDDVSTVDSGNPNYMKSDRGVVGYIQLNGLLYICEAENEKESGSVLSLILDNKNSSPEWLTQVITKALRKRGREISSLWG